MRHDRCGWIQGRCICTRHRTQSCIKVHNLHGGGVKGYKVFQLSTERYMYMYMYTVQYMYMEEEEDSNNGGNIYVHICRKKKSGIMAGGGEEANSLLTCGDTEVVPALGPDDVGKLGVGEDNAGVGTPGSSKVDGASASNSARHEGVASVGSCRQTFLCRDGTIGSGDGVNLASLDREGRKQTTRGKL